MYPALCHCVKVSNLPAKLALEALSTMLSVGWIEGPLYAKDDVEATSETGVAAGSM